MEDPESEWAIQEYSQPSKEGETETTMVRWILNRGYVIGKKMVITGIAITSAPLVLPPLLVCSAMGVAFSVPFGFVIASYVCTNTLMNRLLPYTPTPASPLLLEYYPDEDEEGVDCTFDLDEGCDDNYRQTEEGLLYTNEYEDDDIRNEIESLDDYEEKVEALTTNNVDGDVDVDEKGYSTDDEVKDDDFRQEMETNLNEQEREDEDDVVQREYDNEEEETEQMEDINQGLDDLKENVTHQEEEEEEEEEEERILEIEEKVEALMTNVDGDVEEKGEDNIKAENVVQEDYSDVTEAKLGENEDDKEREDEVDVVKREYDIEEEKTEQMEDINQGIETHEMSSTNSSGVDEKGYEEDDGEFLEGDDDSLQEERNNKEEEETKDEMEEIRDEGKIDDALEHESVSNEVFEEGTNVEMKESVIIKEIESQKLVKNEEPVGEMHRVVILDQGNEENNFNSREIEELDLVARKVDTESDEKVVKDDMKKTVDASEDAILKTKKQHLIDSNKDAREIGNESRLDLFNEKHTSKGGDEAKENTADVDVMSLLGFRHAQLDSDKVKDASKTDRKTPSREDILEDEKIWEKIGAMRAIVGYKAPSKPTSMEELKALYVFTGVEPPASFKGDSDHDEVNSKLKFLMSIVGVK